MTVHVPACPAHADSPPTAQDADLPQSFARVVQTHEPLVRRALRQLGVHDDALDDASQDVFVVLYRRIADYDSDRSLKNWLWGIAKGVASGYRRSRRRADRLRAAARALEPAPTPGPEDAVARREALDALEDFLDGLDDDKCAVFVMADVEGRTGPEIASRLGINLNTVYARLRVARQRFERSLRRHRSRPRWAAWAPWAWGGFRPVLATMGVAVVAATSMGSTPAVVPDAVPVERPSSAVDEASHADALVPADAPADPEPIILGAVHGRVVDADGDPWVGAWICIEHDVDALAHCGESDDAGWLRMDGLSPGRYRVTASTTDRDQTQRAEVAAGATVIVEMTVARETKPTVARSRERSDHRDPSSPEPRPVGSRPLLEPPQEYVVARPPTEHTPLFEVRPGFVDALVAASSGL